jgi:hypothetical protein
MNAPRPDEAIPRIGELLAAFLGLEPERVRAESDPRFDAVFTADPLSFLVEYKPSGNPAAVAGAIEQLGRLDRSRAPAPGVVPLIAVPFMGPGGKRLCAERDVSWLDLSGNARIVVLGLRIVVEGRPNRYKQRGRPSSVFAPKASRIVRWLLMHPSRFATQREIASETGMDEGYTSRVVSRLEADELVVRDEDGALRVRDPDLLLDAWAEAYDFERHGIVRGHLPARSGDQLVGLLGEALDGAGVEHAFTGLAGAWALDRFAAFRIATVYVAQDGDDLLGRLSFRPEDRGANVWIVTPNDAGVFQGARRAAGFTCAHPVQVYLDLKAHPERAREAAAHLRENLLTWRADA